MGVDDTDSPRGGCTTYVASLAIDRLAELGATFIDYPNLVRLNPNIPWKTRGNGAVCLRFAIDEELVGRAIGEVLRVVEEESDLGHEACNPVVAALVGWPSGKLRRLGLEAVRGVVDRGYALSVAREEGVELHVLKDDLGVVGALAAIGNMLEGDHTYELLAYRVREMRGRPRAIDEGSVVEMDQATRPYTFNNYDYEEGRVLVAPHGPDPVLYGVRGEAPEEVRRAAMMVEVGEPIERWTIFRTNQGTDEHLRAVKVAEARPYMPVAIRGRVASKPRALHGGHVVFTVEDETGTIQCAAYEPTGSFRKVVLGLEVGDEVEVYGGVRPPSNTHPATVNLEKIRVLRLVEVKVEANPRCPRCGARAKSMGRGKGYQCDKCRLKLPPNTPKEVTVKPRSIAETLYIPPPRAHRHLTKPYTRYGREKPARPLTPTPTPLTQFHWVNPEYSKK